MDARQAMSELCTILGVGSIIPVSTEDIVARVRELAAQSAETHSRLDDAGVAKNLDLPVRVGLLRKEVRRALDGWELANSRVDQANEEVVAARGDLRVERERADMLEKKLSGQQSNVDEAQRRAKAMIEEGDKTRSVLALHGANTLTDKFDPLSVVVGRVLDRLVKERDKANEELSETRQALGGFMGPDYRISEEVKKVVAIRDMLAARANEAEQKMMLAVSDLGTMTAERNTERTECQKAYARLHEVYRERDVEHGRAQDLELRLADCARGDAHINAERDRYKANRDEAYRLLGRERTEHRAVASERDTLAARVKELEGRQRGQSLIFDSSNMSRARRVYVVFEYRDGSDTKVLIKDNNAFGNRSIDFDAPVSSTAVNPAKPGLQPMTCPCGGKIEFGRERVGHCMTCGASCRAMDPPPAIHDPDVREMPFERVNIAPLTAALVEANRYEKLWRERAQKCQQALRRIRSLTGDMSFALDEDWGADDDS